MSGYKQARVAVLNRDSDSLLVIRAELVMLLARAYRHARAKKNQSS